MLLSNWFKNINWNWSWGRNKKGEVSIVTPTSVEAFGTQEIINLHCRLMNILRMLEVDLKNVGREAKLGYMGNVLPTTGMKEEWYYNQIRELHVKIQKAQDRISERELQLSGVPLSSQHRKEMFNINKKYRYYEVK